jgi:hypothetical protein
VLASRDIELLDQLELRIRRKFSYHSETPDEVHA